MQEINWERSRVKSNKLGNQTNNADCVSDKHMGRNKIDEHTNRDGVNDDRCPKSIRTLQLAHSQLIASEQQGNETIMSLRTQRETLEKANDNIKKTKYEISRSRWLLQKMLSCWRN